MNQNEIFKPLLKSEEKLLWTGQPKQGFIIRDRDMILIPISIIVIGFAGFINWMVIFYEGSIQLKLIAFVLGIFAINFLIIRFIRDSFKRKHIHFAITNQRVIKKFGVFKKEIRTLPLANLGIIELIEDKKGVGYISFGNNNSLFTWLFGNFRSSEDSVAGFELISDAKRVFDLLKVLQNRNLAADLKQDVSLTSLSNN